MILRWVIFVCLTIVGTPVCAATFTATRDLSFGTLVPIAISGSVTVSLNGAISTNGVVSIAPTGTTYSSGRTVFTGSGPDTVDMHVLSQTVTLSNGNGGTVTISNFTITPKLQIPSLNSSANADVGGQMNFTAASTPGNYNGTVQIRADSTLDGNATVTLPITLTLWRALSVSQTQQLNFGGIEMSGGNSVVEVAASGGGRSIVSGSSGIKLVQNRPGASGTFTVTGQPNTAVTVTLPASTTLTGPGNPMTVNTFKSSPATTTLSSTGNLTLNVGARLNIGAAQAPGTYSGTYDITVSY